MTRVCLWLSLAILSTVGIRAQTAQIATGVHVPALVELKSGEIAYDLVADDFTIQDNGSPQKVTLNEELSPKPLSVLLLIQIGRSGGAQLSKIARLDDLLDSIVTSPKDEIAVLTFDSHVHVIQPFSADQDKTSSSLASLRGGDTGAALFDAIHAAISTIRTAQSNSRRIIVLISGEHDHGSNASDPESLIQDVSSVNASIYAFSFSANSQNPFKRLESINPLAMTLSAMQKNPAEALTSLTGGEFHRFDSEKRFEQTLADTANHIHNRYNLTFQPSNPQPGFHALTVQVRQGQGNVVSARSGYWQSSESPSGSAGGSQ